MRPKDIVVDIRSAHWGWNEHRYFGHKVFEELLGSESFMGLTALSVIGKRLSQDCSAVLEDAANALTLADPRIWPLKLTRVVAAYGGTLPAFAAGLLVQEGAQIGPWAAGRAAAVLVWMRERIGNHLDDGDLVDDAVRRYLAKHAFVWGFGTPFRSKDERLVAFSRCVERRGRDRLPHWRTMQAVAKSVRAITHAEPNIVLGVAAVCLDMGLPVDDIGTLTTTLMQHMFYASAVEATRKDGGVLRQLPDEYVAFEGHEPRSSPRSMSA